MLIWIWETHLPNTRIIYVIFFKIKPKQIWSIYWWNNCNKNVSKNASSSSHCNWETNATFRNPFSNELLGCEMVVIPGIGLKHPIKVSRVCRWSHCSTLVAYIYRSPRTPLEPPQFLMPSPISPNFCQCIPVLERFASECSQPIIEIFSINSCSRMLSMDQAVDGPS